MSQKGRQKKQKVKEEDEENHLDEISKIHEKVHIYLRQK